mgnify:FL=1
MKQDPSEAYLLRGNSAAILILCSIVALLMTIFSGLGLAFPDLFYPSPEIAEMFLTNDLVNLIIGSLFFLISLVLFSRDELVGTLLIPGALIYVIYNYFAYLLGKPFAWSSLGNLLLVLLSFFVLFYLLRSIDHHKIKSILENRVAEKLSSWILILFGLAFIVLALSEIIPGILDGSIPPLGEKAVSVVDILVSIGWLIGGVLLLQRRALGYSLGLGLLLAASSLFIGLILYFFLAPLISGRFFDWFEVLTVSVMGMICFVPSYLFIKGVVRSEKAREVV